MSQLLDQVKDEQGYIVVRERTHRNTAESTNSRVKWWSIFQLGVLVGEGVFQVWWLKRFFEVCPAQWYFNKMEFANLPSLLVGQAGCVERFHDICFTTCDRCTL